MAKGKKNATKAKTTNPDNNNIVDERFIAATTRPQFKSGRKFGKDTTKHADSDDDAEEGGNLHVHNSNKTKEFEETFGESLAAAIQSDSRFAEALTNQEKFGCVPLMDKYGRKTKKKKSKSKPKVEGVQDDESDTDSDTEQSKPKEKDSGLESHDMESRIAYLNALSRGEISVSSSDDDSSDDSSVDKPADGDRDSDDDSSASIDVYGKAGVFDPSYNQLPGDAEDEDEGVELTDSPTPYLAILNLDWTNIRAVDIYAMLQSFCPPGTLKKIEVYPSDFGKEMMEKERVEGPSGLWKKPKKKKGNDVASETDDTSDSDESNDEDGESFDGEQLNDGGSVESDEENMSEDDGVEDIMNLNEATAKLYSHFPPQSEVAKNSRNGGEDSDEEGFDREKLRAYEASKLRYYFAIATFTSPGAAEKVYNDVDGMEMEHSAAEIDIRALPADEYPDTIEGRELRDECDHLPGKYAPPETVVAALRQSRISCSWETGDAQRDKKLTRWGMGKDAWQAMAEGDDIKFYLASDNSSAHDESDSGDSDSDEEAKGRKQKASNMRSLLGLGGSDDDEIVGNGDESVSSDGSESSEQGEPSTKQVTFTPGKGSLEEKNRSKVNNTGDETEELTPFQKYLEKRKQKRKERKEAARNKRLGVDDDETELPEDDGMYEYDPEFGVAKFSDEESGDEMADKEGSDHDDFFLEESDKKAGKKDKRSEKKSKDSEPKATQASTKEELELLIAGDDGRFVLFSSLHSLSKDYGTYIRLFYHTSRRGAHQRLRHAWTCQT